MAKCIFLLYSIAKTLSKLNKIKLSANWQHDFAKKLPSNVYFLNNKYTIYINKCTNQSEW
jgi:hypothetical protein